MLRRPLPPPASPGRIEHLAAFLEIGSALGSTLEFEEVIQRILDTAKRTLSADVVTLRLLHGELLRLVGVSGMEGEFPGEFYTLKLGESCLGRALTERRPLPVHDLHRSPLFIFRDLAHTRNLRSLLSIPLEFRDRVVGGMTCYWHRPRRHRRDEIRLATALAAQAALALEQAQHHADSIHSLFALARALESKDAYTVGHGERVTRLALLIAQDAGLGAHDLNLLRQVCPLHDVGKVGIAERILLKRGSLNAAERSRMARHPTIGEEILAPVRAFRDGVGIVRSHHERVDGSGYPDGLKGEEIPLLARITTLADAFDAMTSRRPYREALSVVDAAEQIRRGAGTQFDAGLAKPFLRLVRRHDARLSGIIERRAR